MHHARTAKKKHLLTRETLLHDSMVDSIASVDRDNDQPNIFYQGSPIYTGRLIKYRCLPFIAMTGDMDRDNIQ